MKKRLSRDASDSEEVVNPFQLRIDLHDVRHDLGPQLLDIFLTGQFAQERSPTALL